VNVGWAGENPSARARQEDVRRATFATAIIVE
jgi:hypothetical protein